MYFHLSKCGLERVTFGKWPQATICQAVPARCVQFTFFFSTVAELQLSVRWPNVIEAPYEQSNVISPAFILCLWWDREWPWRDGIWIGAGCLRKVPIDQEIEGHNACNADRSNSSLDMDYTEEEQEKRTHLNMGTGFSIFLKVLVSLINLFETLLWNIETNTGTTLWYCFKQCPEMLHIPS